jgi:hypothetical protein
VAEGRFRITIHFDQHEARGIVDGLNHVEPSHARLLQTGRGILLGRGFEGFDGLGFHLDLNVHDEHAKG